jgi:hypothetical protein
MLTVVPDTDVSLVVALVDASGNAITAQSIEYRVLALDGTELVARTAVAGFADGAESVTVSIPASFNSLAEGQLRDGRVVDLFVLSDGNTITLRSSYAVQQPDPLKVGENTFQSLAGADFQAAHMPNLDGWNNATTEQRIAALVDARIHICQLNFTAFDNRPEGTVARNTISPAEFFGAARGLADVTADQFMQLPGVFRQALCLAQIAEANALLGGDPVDQRRKEGIVLDTVGESKQMYRVGKPLELPVCRRALSYLSGYITFAKGIAR